MKSLQIALIIIFLNGCASSPNSSIKHSEQQHQPLQYSLQQHYQEWRDTPYEYGGLSKRGIDCSGFVYITYRDQLGISLPRTGIEQSKMGRAVSQSSLKTGDLVFFKTGTKQHHAGIYIGQQQFIHASSSKGVTLSRLDNSYWKKHYWMSRRL